MQNRCAEIKVRAEHQAGELLAGEVQWGGDRKSESRLHDATLKNYGIERTQSHRWQSLARIPEDTFESQDPQICEISNGRSELQGNFHKVERVPEKQKSAPTGG
jgi:hypothetical protein